MKATQEIFDALTNAINLLQDICSEVVEELEEPVTYKVGDRFQHNNMGQYILAQTGENIVCLINLKDGDMWDYSFKVNDSLKITQEEFSRITDGHQGEFTLIKEMSGHKQNEEDW